MEPSPADDHQIAYPIHGLTEAAPTSPQRGQELTVTTRCRALQGMQKEAIVQRGVNGPCWRMLSDEGPWLNGTDLAPFPLAFFTAGLISSYLAEFAAVAAAQKLALSSLAVSMDNYYSMEGSALQGTMRGSALPVEIGFRVGANTSREHLLQLAYAAAGRSAADAYLRNGLASRFSLTANGIRVNLEDGAPVIVSAPDDPLPLFDAAAPLEAQAPATQIIERCAEAEAGSRDGAVGLKTEQKRVVHVHGDGALRGDGLSEIKVACVKPVGSLFRFLSDVPREEGGSGRAPCGLTYLSAGLSFCFMTQLGRYAQLAKQDLQAYRIVQDTRFTAPAAGDTPQTARAGDIDTHVYVEGNETEEASRRLLRMGEQTCYLHAAARMPLKNRIRLQNTSEN